MAPLLVPLSEPPDSSAQLTIIERFWQQIIPKSSLDIYRPYFWYYKVESQRLQFGLSTQQWQSSALAATTHEDILCIVDVLSSRRDLCRPQIRDRLRERFPEAGDQAINWSIDLALRLWLMLNVRDEAFSLHAPQTSSIQWDDWTTLLDFVEHQFPTATLSYDSRNRQFDHTFIAVNIVRYSGLSIEWTTSLADHLRLDRRRRVLRIFPFKHCLQSHLDMPSDSTDQRPIIPHSVLRETILSLSLLFPHWDHRTNDFLRQHNQTFHLNGPFDKLRPQDFSEFNHWKERLSELYEIFHEPAVGMAQMWADRRNPQQWLTFWIAMMVLVLTILFGIISTVMGALQTWASIESLKIAREQVKK